MMAHRHLNPVIRDSLVVMAAAAIAALFLYTMFTYPVLNHPELGRARS